MGACCFRDANSLKRLELPSLTEMDDYCFEKVNSITRLEFPNLTKIGFNCFKKTKSLKSLVAPNLTEIGDWCFHYAKSLKSVNVPKLELEYKPRSFVKAEKVSNSLKYKINKIIKNAIYKFKEYRVNMIEPNIEHQRK
jgi:hypothetical protein